MNSSDLIQQKTQLEVAKIGVEVNKHIVKSAGTNIVGQGYEGRFKK